MVRSDRWNTSNEIKKHFPESSEPNCGAGPVIYVEKEKKYIDDSQSHIAVIGKTGKGKSQCCSLPFMREIFEKNESLIINDSKGEGLWKNFCFIPSHYQKFILDFRCPRKSPDRWNPYSYPKKLYDSDDRDENDVASSLIDEFWKGVYDSNAITERFWTDAAANYAKGLTYGLFETAEDEYINLESTAIMMEQSEIKFASSTVIRSFYDSLPSNSLAKRNLASYVTGPNETRASIHSVATQGIETFSRSKGLMEMLADDTIDIKNFDVNRPFVVIIVIPDETDTYDALAGLFITQLTQHLILTAHKMGGKLPIRVNIILEELGSIGKSIPALPKLIAASRSRNIRIMIVLQSNSQLIDVYGKSKAEIINDGIDITFCFSTNSWETLNEWSQRCGERQIEIDGHIVKEPVITPSQLAAMPTCTALVMIRGQFKYITKFPLYDDLYDNSAWTAPEKNKEKESSLKYFNFEERVKDARRKQIEEKIRLLPSAEKNSNEKNIPAYDEPSNGFSFDIDRMIADIDAKIAELEEEEKAQKIKAAGNPENLKIKDYTLSILILGDDHEKIAEVISKAMNISQKEAEDLILEYPVDICITDGEEAKNVENTLSELDCLVCCSENYE